MVKPKWSRWFFVFTELRPMVDDIQIHPHYFTDLRPMVDDIQIQPHYIYIHIYMLCPLNIPIYKWLLRVCPTHQVSRWKSPRNWTKTKNSTAVGDFFSSRCFSRCSCRTCSLECLECLECDWNVTGMWLECGKYVENEWKMNGNEEFHQPTLPTSCDDKQDRSR